MLEILIISPFPYALKTQEEAVKQQLFCDDISSYRIYSVHALPREIDEKISGQSYDCAYVDCHYISEEIAVIREHIRGNKTIWKF